LIAAPGVFRVIGIDPGYGRLGFGVVDRLGSKLCCVDCGVIETAPGPLPSRLKTIQTEVRSLFEKHRPQALATEKLFFTKNQTTGLLVAQALGCVLSASDEFGLPWTEYSPPVVKQAVTGVGSADKKQVQFMVTKLLGLKEVPKPDDAADALAVALTLALRTPH